MHSILTALVFAAALWCSVALTESLIYEARTGSPASRATLNAAWTVLAWGLFYYLTH